MARRKKARRRTIVTREQLVAELAKLTSPTIVVLETLTDPTMRKKAGGNVNPYWKKAKTLARVRGMLGGRYEGAVNRAAKKADPDAAKIRTGSRKWGARRTDAPLVDYRGHVYLDFHLKTALRIEYCKAGNLHRIDDRELRPFLRGRLDVPVHWRNYRLDHVREVRINGTTFVVREPIP